MSEWTVRKALFVRTNVIGQWRLARRVHIPDFKSAAVEMSAENWFLLSKLCKPASSPEYVRKFSPCDRTVANSGAQVPTKFQLSRGPD